MIIDRTIIHFLLKSKKEHFLGGLQKTYVPLGKRKKMPNKHVVPAGKSVRGLLGHPYFKSYAQMRKMSEKFFFSHQEKTV